MVTDNAIAQGIVTQTIKQQKLRSMNMRYFWLIDQQNSGNINVRWRPGYLNLANYFTKHFSAPYHIKIRPFYLQQKDSPNYITHIPNPNKRNNQSWQPREGVLKSNESLTPYATHRPHMKQDSLQGTIPKTSSMHRIKDSTHRH